jgi:hypothetical protein
MHVGAKRAAIELRGADPDQLQQRRLDAQVAGQRFHGEHGFHRLG